MQINHTANNISLKREIDEDKLNIELIAAFEIFGNLFGHTPMAALSRNLDIPVKIKLIETMQGLSLKVYGETLVDFLSDNDDMPYAKDMGEDDDEDEDADDEKVSFAT